MLRRLAGLPVRLGEERAAATAPDRPRVVRGRSAGG
jgi:hypothetical protein